MATHDLFTAAQELWLGSSAGPQLLASARMVTGALSALAAAAAFQNAVRDLELEATWTRSDRTRFRIINWIKVLGLILSALYFFCAGVFELERTSSPHRLVVANVAFSTVFLGSFLDSLYWRNHYRRKRQIKGQQ